MVASIVCGKQGREETVWGDQAAGGVMATGEALHEKKHATHRSAVGTDLLVSRRECERAGQ